MARTTIATVHELLHAETCGTRTHFYSELHVAYGTLEADSVKPMREDDRRHPFPLGIVVEYHVRILRPHHHRGNETYNDDCDNRPAGPPFHGLPSPTGRAASFGTVDESVL